MKNNKVTKYLQRQAETSRQWMVLGAVLFVTGIMSVNIFGITLAANTGNTDVNLNVTAGALNLDSVPTDFEFPDAILGATTTNNTSTEGITVNDTSGSGAGWDLTMYYNTDFTNGGSSQMVINATDPLTVVANLGDVVNYGAADSTGVTQQANFDLTGVGAGSPGTLVIAVLDNGQGAYNFFNLEMSYTIPVTADAVPYTTEIIFTVA